MTTTRPHEVQEAPEGALFLSEEQLFSTTSTRFLLDNCDLLTDQTYMIWQGKDDFGTATTLYCDISIPQETTWSLRTHKNGVTSLFDVILRPGQRNLYTLVAENNLQGHRSDVYVAGPEEQASVLSRVVEILNSSELHRDIDHKRFNTTVAPPANNLLALNAYHAKLDALYLEYNERNTSDDLAREHDVKASILLAEYDAEIEHIKRVAKKVGFMTIQPQKLEQ